MPFIPPASWATNETVTSAKMNAQLRDNMRWLGTDKYRCRAVRVATQSIPTGTDTAISMTAEDFDVGTMHDSATNSSRITIPADGAGHYYIGGSYNMAQNGTNRRVSYLRLNGTTDLVIQNVPPPNTGDFGASLATYALLAANDYVELVVNQNSGGALAAFEAALWVVWDATA